jgi:hypothetical protein
MFCLSSRVKTILLVYKKNQIRTLFIETRVTFLSKDFYPNGGAEQVKFIKNNNFFYF